MISTLVQGRLSLSMGSLNLRIVLRQPFVCEPRYNKINILFRHSILGNPKPTPPRSPYLPTAGKGAILRGGAPGAPEEKNMGLVKNFMAKRCKNCLLCKYARDKPETAFGRLMAWHGKFCPFWRAYEEVHGAEAPTSQPAEP